MLVSIRAALGTLLVLCAAAGCKRGDDGGPTVGSNSNWLRACDVPADCSSAEIPECACGVCTVQCASDEDCAGIDDARCAPSAGAAARSACEVMAGDLSTGLCLPRCAYGECDPNQACVDGACVLAELPDVALCGELPPSSDADRRHADQLLALVQARRAAGDLMCADLDVSAQPELRFSPLLLCTARALADDMRQTRRPGVIDSQGRDTIERLELAGYAASRWGEAFALEAISPERALELMLADPFACSAIADPAFLDVAAAASGDAYVLTLAAP